MSPKLELPFLIKIDAYHSPRAYEQNEKNCDKPKPKPDICPRKKACLFGPFNSEANWFEICSSAPNEATVRILAMASRATDVARPYAAA